KTEVASRCEVLFRNTKHRSEPIRPDICGEDKRGEASADIYNIHRGIEGSPHPICLADGRTDLANKMILIDRRDPLAGKSVRVEWIHDKKRAQHMEETVFMLVFDKTDG